MSFWYNYFLSCYWYHYYEFVTIVYDQRLFNKTTWISCENSYVFVLKLFISKMLNLALAAESLWLGLMVVQYFWHFTANCRMKVKPYHSTQKAHLGTGGDVHLTVGSASWLLQLVYLFCLKFQNYVIILFFGNK